MASYPTRAGSPIDVAGITAAWWDVLQSKPWVTAALFDAAVTEALTSSAHLPTPAEFLGYCQMVKDDQQREAAKALPAPQRDDNEATPEERERWAREDVILRAYGARLRPTPPELLARLSDEDRRDLIDYDERNQRVANWVHLSVPERRALDRRSALRRKEQES